MRRFLAYASGESAGVERLVVAEARCCQMLGWHTISDQQLHNGDRARRRQLPVGGERESSLDRLLVGVAIDSQDPLDVRRDLRGDILDGDGKRSDPVHPSRRQVGAADGKQHLALEHEPVADDLDSRPIRQHIAQLAEELAAIALEFLHLRGQRDVQLLPEIVDLRILRLRLYLR